MEAREQHQIAHSRFVEGRTDEVMALEQAMAVGVGDHKLASLLLLLLHNLYHDQSLCFKCLQILMQTLFVLHRQIFPMESLLIGGIIGTADQLEVFHLGHRS